MRKFENRKGRNMRALQVLGIIIAIALIIFGLAYPVPEKYVYVSSSSSAYYSTWDENRGAEYLGGDAYNYQIEASLKAGYTSGVLVMKSITFVGGLLLFFIVAFSHAKITSIKKHEVLLAKMNSTLITETQTLNQLYSLLNTREINAE